MLPPLRKGSREKGEEESLVADNVDEVETS